MNIYKYDILVREFPFLKEIVEVVPQEIASLKTQRGDKQLLERKGIEKTYTWQNGGTYDYTKYFAISEHSEITELQSAGKSETGSGDSSEWGAPTVGEQLYAKKLAPRWIVEKQKNDHDANGNGQVTFLVTIHKMSGKALEIYHFEQIDRAAAELKAELAAASM